MADLSNFDVDAVGNRNNNIFGLPFTEEESQVVLLPIQWEVTVSCNAGTARCIEHIFKASSQVDLFDPDVPEGWKKGFFMKEPDRKILMKSDYLRKEAELYIDFISHGQEVKSNKFMMKSLKEINEGSAALNKWVYEQTKDLLNRDKLVGLIGGDHSVPLGYYKALSEKYGSFGILQIDAHCDLRKSYENLNYSHASIMYNALEEIPEIERLVQVGVRDYSAGEWSYICDSNSRIIPYLDEQIKERQYSGQTWNQIVDEIVTKLPQQVYFSFDIDGLDPKLCPHTGTPVHGGLEAEQVFYLFKKILKSGRKLIGFDLNEVGIRTNEWDENVGARVLFKLCNLMVS